MHQSKLLSLLKTLSKEELRQLGDFLDSPYFNTNKQVQKLYNYLKRSHPVYVAPKLKKEAAFAKVFPEIKGYDDTRMRQVMFKMTRLVEEFMVAQEVWEKKKYKQRLLIQSLGKRNLYKYFVKEIEGRLKELGDLPAKDMEDYQEQLWLNHELFFHPSTAKFKKGIQSIEEVMNALDLHFITAKLRYGIEMLTREKTLSEKYDIWLLEEVKEGLIDKFEGEKNILLEIFSQLFALQSKERDDLLFDKIKDLFVQNISFLKPRENRVVIQILSNSAVKHMNNGIDIYFRKYFDLLKIGLENKIILGEKTITDSDFTNVVAVGSALKEFNWISNFIKFYGELLDSSVFESATNLSYAYLNYHKEAYDNVLFYLGNVNYLPSYGFRVKSLRMRAYYELYCKNTSYEDALISDIQSFDQYIRRNGRITENRKEAYLKFIFFTKKLCKLKSRLDNIESDKFKLLEEIKNSEKIMLKKWLINKTKEL